MLHRSVSDHLVICSTQFSAIASVLFTVAGVDYIRTGMGCHPILAGVIAVSLLVLPHMLEDITPRKARPEDLRINIRERKS